jgi:hypothetical protein
VVAAPAEMTATVAAACEVGTASTMAATTVAASAAPGIGRSRGQAGGDNRNSSCETKDNFA